MKDNSKALTLEERITQYEKHGLTVEYSKEISDNNPLRLMYADVTFNGKAVREIIDGTDFQVTLIHAPKDALSIQPTYDASGIMTGFEEL